MLPERGKHLIHWVPLITRAVLSQAARPPNPVALAGSIGTSSRRFKTSLRLQRGGPQPDINGPPGLLDGAAALGESPVGVDAVQPRGHRADARVLVHAAHAPVGVQGV